MWDQSTQSSTSGTSEQVENTPKMQHWIIIKGKCTVFILKELSIRHQHVMCMYSFIFTLTTVSMPSLVMGLVRMVKCPDGSPLTMRYTAFQLGLWGWSLSTTVKLVTTTFTLFSGTSPENYGEREGRKQMREERREATVRRMGETTLCWCCPSIWLMHVNNWFIGILKHLLVPLSIF